MTRRPITSPVDAKRARRATLAADAIANPFRFYTSEDVGILLDLGENVMTTLRSVGAPVIGRKMNPALLLKWLESNADRVPKVRVDEKES